MTAVGALVAHSLRRRRGFLIAALVTVVAFQFFMIAAARSLEESGGFSELRALMPDFLQRMTNMAAASFQGIVLFGYSHPAVLVCLIALAVTIGTEPAAEIESKFVDLVMARPVRRAAVVNRTLVVLIAATVGAVGCMVAATTIGLRLLAPSLPGPEPRVILSLAVNLALVVVAWGAIALMLAAFSKRRATAAAACGLLAFATFVLDYVGRFWQAVSGISRISPFHYFSPFEMIGGRPLSLVDVAVLLAIIGSGSVIAHVVYARRDL